VPNVVKVACAAGTLEHAWVPALRLGGYISTSCPFGICVTFTHHRRSVVSIAGKYYQEDVEPGCVQIAGAEPVEWHVVSNPSDVVEITASVELRRSIAHEMRAADMAERADLHGGMDAVVWALACRVRSMLRHPRPASSLACEELILALYRHIHATRLGGRLKVRGSGKLDSRRLARVTSYIEAHLTEDTLGIATLARVACLSPFHFLRSFKRTLGMTPHQYVHVRRLERIRTVLEAGEQYATVAAQYGFTHARHFSQAYRRHFGLWPWDRLAGFPTSEETTFARQVRAAHAAPDDKCC
jgi:AraC family transcriptional regulator